MFGRNQTGSGFFLSVSRQRFPVRQELSADRQRIPTPSHLPEREIVKTAVAYCTIRNYHNEWRIHHEQHTRLRRGWRRHE